MNYLSVDGISKSFGERVLFEEITFGIGQGQKVALVGVNGSGKTTLLKILAGIDVPDSGQVVLNNKITTAYLEQQPIFNTDSIIEAVLSGNAELAKLIEDYEYHLAKAESSSESMEKLSELMEKMNELDAWTFESQIKEILGKLGIHNLNQSIAEMSGGQKKRVGIARALMEKPDLVILDEPTNHLDLEAIEWLEKYLATSQMAIIMVTHDRYFLENVTNEIIELDNYKVYNYSGNYSYFLEKKAERELNAQSEKEKAANLYKKELDWIRRQPKARSTKAKYRVDAFQDIKKKAHEDLSKSEVTIDIEQKRQGGKILEVESLTKSFDNKPVIKEFSYTFKRGERVGVIGHNGSGKSTLLNMLTGRLKPDSGNVDPGQSTVFGYYDQTEPDFKAGTKVIEVVQEVANVIDTGKEEVSASRLLTQFNFSPKAQYDYVDNLSGGEKRRLQLLKVLIAQPNFLILDEPTNDLDLITLRTLEEFLHNFKGCLIIVSHDRYFMDRLVDHLFVFERGKPIEDFNGNYTLYRANLEDKRRQVEPTVTKKTAAEKVKSAAPSKKLTFNEKREFDQLEKELDQLSSLKNSLEAKLVSGETEHQKLIDWGKELDQVKTDIDEKEMRWLELSEYI